MSKKKQKSKKSGRSSESPPRPEASGDDPIRACIELDLKPPARRVSRGGASMKDDINNCIDNKYAVVHWSDAHDVDIRDGEPALIVRAIPAASQLQCGDNDGFISTVCNVRISPSAPSSGSLSSRTSGTPQKKSSQEAASRGVMLLSPDSLYGHFSPVIPADLVQAKATAATAAGSFASPPASSSAAKNAPFSSPSKSRFSFSKGGGGDALISPSPPKRTSPSGSAFSFSKGGGGDSLLSPGQTKATRNIQQDTRGPPKKVTVMPLVNIPTQQLRRLCPDAQMLLVCPTNDSRDFSSSAKIIQTLITSKYQGAYVEAPSKAKRGESDHESSEAVSISFRGQTETFRIVDVAPVPIQDRATDQRDDQEELSTLFDRLDVSGDASDGTPHDAEIRTESQLQQFLRTRLAEQNQIDGESPSKIVTACRITSQTSVRFASPSDRAPSAALPTALDVRGDRPTRA